MEISLAPQAIDDLKYFYKSGQKNILQKIEVLIDDIKAHPYTGLGKPEVLKYDLSGKWSRRISKEHRIIYLIEENIIHILSLKGHYEK